ncbi:MAG: glutathione S-transferase family protein [Alphaproteobacteria bacterium]
MGRNLSLTLYGHPDSGHVYKVALLLTVARLPYTYHVVDIFGPHAARHEEFRRHARYQQVPVLLIDGNSYVQSDAILCVLAEILGDFGGETPERMVLAREWLFWEANRLGMCLPQLRYARSFTMEGYNAGALEWLQQRYDVDIARLDQEFRDGRAFILGEKPSIADFSLCGYLFHADQAKVTVPPGVTAWLSRMQALPGWRAPYDLLAGTP